MATNRNTRRIYSTALPAPDLPPVGPMPYNVPTDGMVQLNPQPPIQAPPPLPFPTAPTYTPTFRHQPAGTPGVSPNMRNLPTGGATPASPAIGFNNGMGFQRGPGGRWIPIQRATKRHDPTGAILGTAGGVVGGLAGGAAGGVGGIAGGQLGRAGGNWLARMLNRMAARRAYRPADTLTRDQINASGGRAAGIYNGLTSGNPNDPALAAQRSGTQLGMNMGGTYLDRTITTPGEFAANQKANGLWDASRLGPTNLVQPDRPSHIYEGEDGDIRHASRTPAEVQAIMATVPRVATTRQMMDATTPGMRSGSRVDAREDSRSTRPPMTRDAMLAALQRARIERGR